MKNKPLIKMVLILTAVIAVYITVDIVKTKTAENKKNTSAEALRIAAVSDVTQLSYSNGTHTMTFTLDGGKWISQEYPLYPIKQESVAEIVSLASNLSAVKALGEYNDLSEYGLDEAQATVILKCSDGSEHTFYIGNKINSDYYLRYLETDDKIFTVSDALPYALSYDIYSYIDYDTIPAFISENVYAVSLTYENDIYEYTKTENPEAGAEQTDNSEDETEDTEEYLWSIAKNGEAYENADADIDTALSYIYYLSLTGCISYDAPDSSLQACGLKPPKTTIEVYYTSESGSDEYFSLAVGSLADDDYYYSELNGNQQITMVYAYDIDCIISYMSGVSTTGTSEE